jgi:hypothetical protein
MLSQIEEKSVEGNRLRTIEVLAPSRPRRALRRNCLHLDLWRGPEQPDSDKEFFTPLLHGNTQQASVSGHRERKRHPLDLRSVFTFRVADYLTLDEDLPSV